MPPISPQSGFPVQHELEVSSANLPELGRKRQCQPEVRQHVGRGVHYLLSHTVPGTDLERDAERYRSHHPSVLRSGTCLLPGVAEVLAALYAAGFRMAICSNKPKPFTLQLLDSLGIAALMELAIGPEDAPRLKPAPDMLRAALARLGVAAQDALYVGDMVVDVETARAAGVRVWAIPTGSDDPATLQAAQPDRLLRDFRELGELIPRKRGSGQP